MLLHTAPALRHDSATGKVWVNSGSASETVPDTEKRDNTNSHYGGSEEQNVIPVSVPKEKMIPSWLHFQPKCQWSQPVHQTGPTEMQDLVV